MQKLQSLVELIPKSEQQEITSFIPEGLTPIWMHWEAFVIQHTRLGKSLQTIESVRSGIRVLIRKGEIYSIEQANNPKLLTEVTLDLQEKYGLRGNTRNTYIKNLNTYFLWLEKNEYIIVSNINKVPKSSVIFYEQNCLSHDQVAALFEYLRTRKFSSELERLRTLLFVELLAFTGARPCELRTMKYDSIYQDIGGWTIKIEGRKLKGRIRYYQCPQHLTHLFLSYQQIREQKQRYEEALFVSMSSFDGWKKSGMDSFFSRLSNEVGYNVSPYAFRRYVATHLNAQGVSMQNIGRHLGHLRISTTERYVERSGILTNVSSKIMAQTRQMSSSCASLSISTCAL